MLSSITRTAEAAGGDQGALQTFVTPGHAKFSDTTLDSVDHSTGALTCSTTLQFDSIPLPSGYGLDFNPTAISYSVQARADGGAGAIVRLQGPPQLAAQIAETANSIGLYKRALQPRPGQAASAPRCGDGTYGCGWARLAQQAAAGHKPEPPLRSPGDVEWRTLPNPDELVDLYPDVAVRQARTGNTVVSCKILSDLRPGDCTIIAESPSGLDFGSVAKQVAHHYVAKNDGDVGRTVTISQHWAIKSDN